MSDPDDATLEELLQRCRADHAAWINGDGRPYELPADGSILGAVGGVGRGGPETLARQVAVAEQWLHGDGQVELVNGGVDHDLAWLVMIERASVRIAGESEDRRWDLRVTEVFRREPDGWVRVHRHADPLVERRTLPDLLRVLDRGDG